MQIKSQGVANIGAPEGSLGDPVDILANEEFARRPMIMGAFDFNCKLYKIYYDQGCKACYGDCDIDSKCRHVFITSLVFKAVKFCWTGENYGILDIPTDEFNSLAFEFHQKKWSTMVNSHSPYDCIINSLLSDGLVKVYNRINDYHVGDYESGILLLKIILDESGLSSQQQETRR